MFVSTSFNYGKGELVCHSNLEFQWDEVEDREQVPQELLKYAETAIKHKKEIALAFYHTIEDRNNKNEKQLYQGNYVRTLTVKDKKQNAWIYYNRYELVEQVKEEKKAPSSSDAMQLS